MSEETLSHILQALVLLPVVGAAGVMLAAKQGVATVRQIALVTVLATFVLSVIVVAGYDPAATDPAGNPRLLQMVSNARWVAATSESGNPVGPDIRFALGIDGISLWLVALTALLMIPAVLVSWNAIQERAAGFYALMLLLESGMLGVFSALDIILFYIFFEFTLIPLFFMIGIWGGYDRRWAARKFFIYTLAGSLLTFLGLLFIVLSHSWMTGNGQLTFSIPELLHDIPALTSANHPANADFWHNVGPWNFAALFIGFAIKVPLFPFHTWLPLAHVEAPTAGSVLLAGVLLKIGSYGFLRFMLPLVPEACWMGVAFIAILSVIGIIYGALLSLAQDDIKKLVAYSSVSHMGFCLLGLFALNNVGITGSLLQMINHGLSTGALFAMVGMLYERYHTRDIDAYGGLTRKFPIMSFFFVLLAFSSIGLPGLNGFTGEVLSLIGMFEVHPVYGALGLSGIILGAWYMLWLVQRIMYGRLREPIHEELHGHGATHGHAATPPAPVQTAATASIPASQHDAGHHGGHGGHGGGEPVHMSNIPDLNGRELAALIPLVVVIVWIGVYPQFFLRRMEPSIRNVVAVVESKRPTNEQLARQAAPADHTDTPVIAKD